MMPPIAEAMNLPKPSGGGWMFSSLKSLKNSSSEPLLSVATVYKGNRLIENEIDGIRYFLVPLNGRPTTKYNPKLENYWRQIKERVNPDIVHIHGTEYPHGLAYVKANGNKGVVVSIQGLVSVIARYYYAGINIKNKNLITFRDLIKGGIKKGKKDFEKRGKYEIELIKSVDHIIGRTEWDMVHTLAINPSVQYHFVGETLRDPFYNHKWNFNNCEPYSIFVSQGTYPIKGIHMLIKAMPLILREYPEAKIYVAGSDETSKPWYRITGYGKYLKNLINKYKLKDKIIFTGSLNEEEMCRRYLKSNVFVCSSAIENSPNSLGEAQMLGMPYVASFVGGVPEIVNNNEDVLYRFEEIEILAKRIINIFNQREKIIQCNFNTIRYNKEFNYITLRDVYQLVFERLRIN